MREGGREKNVRETLDGKVGGERMKGLSPTVCTLVEHTCNVCTDACVSTPPPCKVDSAHQVMI